MPNTKKVTVDQLTTVVGAITEKSDLRFRKSADKLAKSDLNTALSDEITGKANSADLGDLAGKNTVAKTDLAQTLSDEITGKADAADVYPKSETYTKSEVDTAISQQIGKVYKPAGNKTAAELVAALLIAANLGNVYNTTDTLTLTAENVDLFVDGVVGKSYGPGADVAVVDTDTTGSSPTFKFNVLPGFIDLSGYATKEDAAAASAADIQAIVDGIYPAAGE